MENRRWTLKYGGAAVLVSIVLIATVLFTNQVLSPNIVTAQAHPFLVMLTDPPTVPAGTTQLNITYSGVSLEVTFPNGTTKWLPVVASGTVNAFSLVNMSQTIASTMIPEGSVVGKIEFSISSALAKVNGAVYTVAVLSDKLVVNIANSQKTNGTLGVLLDLHPTLVQIRATDSTGGAVDYFVLVPSATAVVVTDVGVNRLTVGTIVRLGEKDRVKLIRVVEETSRSLVISSASLSVKGNVTDFSVTLRNDGSANAAVSVLTLHGMFNVTGKGRKFILPDAGLWRGHDDKDEETQKSNWRMEIERADTIPFKIQGSSLVPFLGFDEKGHEIGKVSALAIGPGKSVTLSFSGVIQLRQGYGVDLRPHMPLWAIPIVVTPIPSETYTIRSVGAVFPAFSVTAEAA